MNKRLIVHGREHRCRCRDKYECIKEQGRDTSDVMVECASYVMNE